VNLRARPGFARTILAAYIGGSLLTDGVADVSQGDHWGWPWITVGAAALWLLVQHLREQALRGLDRPGTTWARVDTANAAILAVLITLMVIDAQVDPDSPAAGAATYAVAAVYAALLLDFIIQRRQTIQASAQSHPRRPEPNLHG
jgi:hypothetical protein